VSEVYEKVLLVFYQDINYGWDWEEDTECCFRNKEIGQLGLKVEVCKIRGTGRGIDIGSCPLCLGNEDVHM
jgi:hypothetical protein